MANKKRAFRTLESLFGDRLEYRGAPIRSSLNLPSLALVTDGEIAEQLRKKYSTTQLIVLHKPDTQYIGWMYPRLAQKGRVMGSLIPGHILAQGLADMYDKNSENLARDDLTSKVQAEFDQRERHDLAMQAAAQAIAQTATTSEGISLKQLIQSIITSQNKELEYFIREGMQNSATATASQENGRIDVYIDPKNRTVRWEDNGIGMSRATLEDVFFNCFRSLNEGKLNLENGGGGRFGIGGKSFFGLEHDYVSIDTNTALDDGASVRVDPLLEIEDYLPPGRREPGTSIEIRLSDKSSISFERVVEILKKDCCYIPTSIYLHQITQSGEDKTEMINQQLVPEKRKGMVGFDDTFEFGKNDVRIQGYVERGQGLLELLSYSIVIQRMKVDGIQGAINCNSLNTLFSRDSAQQDPLMDFMIQHAIAKSRKISMGIVKTDMQGIGLRLSAYSKYMRDMLLNEDGTPNYAIIEANLDDILSSCSSVHWADHSERWSRQHDKTISFAAREWISEKIDDARLYVKHDIFDGKSELNIDTLELSPLVLCLTTLGSIGTLLYGAIGGNEDVMTPAGIAAAASLGLLALPHVVETIETTLGLAYNKATDWVKDKVVKAHDAYELFEAFSPAALERYRPDRVKMTLKDGLANAAKLIGGGLGIYGLTLLVGKTVSQLDNLFASQAPLPDISLVTATPAIATPTPTPMTTQIPDYVASAASNPSFNSVDLLYTLLGGALLAGAGYLAYREINPKIIKEDNLTQDQLEYLSVIKDCLPGLEDVNVFYSKKGVRSEYRFHKGDILLNPKMPELGQAWKIAAAYLLERGMPDRADELIRANLGGIDG